jgi:hypothetical protein
MRRMTGSFGVELLNRLYIPQLVAWAKAEAAGTRVARVATTVIFKLMRRMTTSFEVGLLETQKLQPAVWAKAEAAGTRVARVATTVIFKLMRRMTTSSGWGCATYSKHGTAGSN